MSRYLRRVAKASKHAGRAHMDRDDAIREAVKHHTLREIADVAGLTHQRVAQIVKQGASHESP